MHWACPSSPFRFPGCRAIDVSGFELDRRLAADSLAVVDLCLCTVRLMNDQRFPWLLLVPRRADMVEMLDLDAVDRQQLWEEIRTASEAVRAVFSPDKLNVAALGNVVSQLHVHVIGRFRDDVAWPAPVWGVGKAEPWPDGGHSEIQRLRVALDS